MLIGVRQGQRRDTAATGEEQIARCAAWKSKYTRLYLCSGKLTIETIYPRRVRVAGLSFSAVAPALTHVCTAGDYGENSAWASGGPARCWRVAACMGRWRALPLHGPPRRVERPYRRCVLVMPATFYKNATFTALVYAQRRTPRSR